jgi:hypothetical protein
MHSALSNGFDESNGSRVVVDSTGGRVNSRIVTRVRIRDGYTMDMVFGAGAIVKSGFWVLDFLLYNKIKPELVRW